MIENHVSGNLYSKRFSESSEEKCTVFQIMDWYLIVHKNLHHFSPGLSLSILYFKVFLNILQNSQENSCARVSLLIKLQAKAWNCIKKGTLAEVFSDEFLEISKNTFFTEHILATAFEAFIILFMFSSFSFVFINALISSTYAKISLGFFT